MRITEISWYTLGGWESQRFLGVPRTSEMRITQRLVLMRITEVSWYTLVGLGIMEASQRLRWITGVP
jgi:hypothetical protein